MIRVIAFTAVVAVHSIAFTERPTNEVAAGVMMLLQFGREVFFALTGFVLTYSAGDRPLRLRSFWPRRLAYVVIPFAVWTVIYHAYNGGPTDGWLLTGSAEYHLYFLLVTVQLYMVFPLILRFVRRTASWAPAMLGVVGVLNLAWLAALQYGTAPAHLGVLWVRGYELVPTYAVWILAGCYAAVHRARLEDVVRRRARLLVGVGAACLAGSEVVYVRQLSTFAPRDAAAVLQPATALMCVGAFLLIGVGALRWADARPDGRPWLRTASDISFGVYLAHPIVLDFLLRRGLGMDPVATVVGIAVPATVAAAFSYVVRFTPLSLGLTGRPRRRPAAATLTQLPGSAQGVLIKEGEHRSHEAALAPLAS